MKFSPFSICSVSAFINYVLSVGGQDTMLMRCCSDWSLGEGVWHIGLTLKQFYVFILCRGKGQVSVTAMVSLQDQPAYCTF